MPIFDREAELLAVLDAVADGLQTGMDEPVLLAECPNKFNDAFEDDLWFAVQTGEDYWEQSHFFEHRATHAVQERSLFTSSTGDGAVQGIGPDHSSDRIAGLRHRLKSLGKAGWREMTGWPGLLALVIEHDQRWFVTEIPNVDLGEIYAWDEVGMFRVGSTERIDSRVGDKRVLIFKTVVPEAVVLLGEAAQRYFHPVIVDEVCAGMLTHFLWSATEAIRRQGESPAALRSGSMSSYLRRSECCSAALRPGEGYYIHRKDETWPKFQPNVRAEPVDYSDHAKVLLTALDGLERLDWLAYFGIPSGNDLNSDQQLALAPSPSLAEAIRGNRGLNWRQLFELAFGEKLDASQELTLLVGEHLAVLIRDNAVFEVTSKGLTYICVMDRVDLHIVDNYPRLLDDLRRSLPR